MKPTQILAAATIAAALTFAGTGIAEAASKPTSNSAATTTKKPVVKKKKKPAPSVSSQKDKIYLQLLENCRRKYGRMNLHRVVVDWKRKRYTCYIY